MGISNLLAAAVGVFGVVMGIAPALQVSRIVRRRRSGDVSTTQLAIVVMGTSLWLAYGMSIGNATLMITNAVATAMNALAFGVALKFREGADNAGGEPAFEQ